MDSDKVLLDRKCILDSVAFWEAVGRAAGCVHFQPCTMERENNGLLYCLFIAVSLDYFSHSYD